MPTHNRGLAQSEQRKSFDFCFNGLLPTGATGVAFYVPFPCSVNAANLAAFSIVADFNLLFTVSRFIPGTGATTWALGSTFVPPVFGTSGVIQGNGVSLPATGSPIGLLMANDVIGYQIGGGSSASCNGLAGTFVVRPVQDVKVYFGKI